MIRRRSTPLPSFCSRFTTRRSTTPLRVHAGNAANPFLSCAYFITCGHPGVGGRTVNQISGEEICPDERSEEGPLFPSDEGCLSRATLRSDGPLCHSHQEICPHERSEEGLLVARDDLRFRPRRKACLSRAARGRVPRPILTPLLLYVITSRSQRRLTHPNQPKMLKWSCTQGATRFRRKLSRPEGMPGPTCP
jgi:hypothetical protein